MKHNKLYLPIMMGLLAVILVGCVRSERVVDRDHDRPAYYTAPTFEPAPTVVAPEVDYTASAGSGAVWTDGRVLNIAKNFFNGDRGDYRLKGNFGMEGRSWHPGYGQGITDNGNHVSVDLGWYVATGNMERGESYCITLTSQHNNWRDNSDLSADQIYSSPDGDPNIAVYVAPDGRIQVTNRYASPVRKPC